MILNLEAELGKVCFFLSNVRPDRHYNSLKCKFLPIIIAYC